MILGKKLWIYEIYDHPFAQLCDMVRHTHLIVEHNPHVADRFGWKNFSMVKTEADVTKLLQIERQHSNKNSVFS